MPFKISGALNIDYTFDNVVKFFSLNPVRTGSELFKFLNEIFYKQIHPCDIFYKLK